MSTVALEMIHPDFTKGFMTAGKPAYKGVVLKNDVELIVLARDLMRELKNTEGIDGGQFANKLGFLFGMFCSISDVNVHLPENDQKEPPSVEPTQFL